MTLINFRVKLNCRVTSVKGTHIPVPYPQHSTEMARYTPEAAAARIQGWWKHWSWKRSIPLDDDPPCYCDWCVCYPGPEPDEDDLENDPALPSFWTEWRATCPAPQPTIAAADGSIVQWSEDALAW